MAIFFYVVFSGLVTVSSSIFLFGGCPFAAIVVGFFCGIASARRCKWAFVTGMLATLTGVMLQVAYLCVVFDDADWSLSFIEYVLLEVVVGAFILYPLFCWLTRVCVRSDRKMRCLEKESLRDRRWTRSYENTKQWAHKALKTEATE